MADKKISELNSAATVYDADDFALVQDGDTKQVNASAVKAYVKDGLSKSDVGLGNVDNTSDANKPVSAATQTALDLKQDAASAATLTGTQTLTNKTISGSSNTLSNIANSSLTNSSITINGNSVSLGGSTTVSAATTNTLTIGTGLSGTSFNGSAATTIAIDSTVVTLEGAQTLTNKTLTSPTINGGTGAFTTLSSTGNTTLGDASGDTLTINGTAVSAPNGLNVNSNQLVLSGGNLGLGVTPSAWQSARRSLQVGGSASLVANATGSGFIFIGNNWYLDSAGTNTYINTAAASRFDLASDGSFRWNTAPSGTAGAAITFSQDMTLTSKGLLVGYTGDGSLSGKGNAIFSGSVGIGTSSPAAYKLDINGQARINNDLLLADSTATRGRAYGDADGVVWRAESGLAQLWHIGSNESMRLDSSGNLGLGVTPNTWTTYKALQVGPNSAAGFIASAGADTYFGDSAYYNAGWKYSYTGIQASAYRQANGVHSWHISNGVTGTSGTTWTPIQAMTLDASGRLIVGDTSTSNSEKLSVVQSTASSGIFVKNTSASFNNVNVDSWANSTTTNGTFFHFRAYSGSANRFYVQDGGQIYSTNATITVISSDERLKQNIQDYDKGLVEVLSLRPRYFEYKDAPGKTESGFIAQEFEQAIPGSLLPIADKPDYFTYKADWFPMLVKAIQELHAEIESLKQKVN